MLPAQTFAVIFTLWSVATSAFRYDEKYVRWNLNENQQAINPLEYWGEWTDHSYTPSPRNWRFPFYTLFLDRFVNGDPENDNINGTLFEHDLTSNQMRNGGDLQGLIDTLDYLQAFGIKVSKLRGNKMYLLLMLIGSLHCRISFHEPAMDLRLVFSSRPDHP